MKIDLQTVNRELMHLSGVERCAIVHSYDALEDQWFFRWVADGRSVGFRVNVEDLEGENAHAILETLRREYLQEALSMWRGTEQKGEAGAEIERLVSNAAASNMPWARLQRC